jgi:bifunctional non-homologous end joining protein LigD
MAHCKDGLPDFHGLRSEDGGAAACLFAFDLLRLNGKDLRPLPLEERRGRLRKVLRGAGEALRFSEHLEGAGEAIFRHACSLGLEGIVSKRRDSRYRSGRSLTWRKIKNPDYERSLAVPAGWTVVRSTRAPAPRPGAC